MDIVNYEQVPIKRIGKVITGKTPATSHEEYYGGQYMFISPVELHGGYRVTKSEKTITEKGLESIKTNSIEGISILVGCIGWDMGNVAMCFEKCATNQQINAITQIDAKYNPYYIYYWLCGKKKYLFSIASVTRTPILSKSTFEEIVIPLPIKKNQDKIANILLKIDQKITLNKQINDNLEQQLMLLYDYWFIQFDFPDNDGNPYQTSGGKMVWNDTLKRNIPENWKVQSVISNCLSSIIKPGVEIFNTKTYLATADVKGTSISTGTIVDYDGRESRANMQPSINSVWFAKMKNSIKHLYLNKEMQPIISSSILSTGFCGLQCNEISFEYIASYVSNAYFEIHKDMLAHGATQEAVNNDDLAGVHIIIPEAIVLRAYHEATQAIYAQISKNICENQELVKLRDWLLPMLMNGQATISD